MPAQSDSPSVIQFRGRAASKIPAGIGVYALCDLDQVPIYVGQSVDGIRSRVRRHTTSARSDVIANRMLDVWEVAYVWAWPISDRAQINVLEARLFHDFHPRSSLMNGSIPVDPGALPFPMPEKHTVQLLQDAEIESRKRVALRLPRQAKQFLDLLDHFLNVKDATELRLALQAHLERLNRYFAELRPTQTEGEAE